VTSPSIPADVAAPAAPTAARRLAERLLWSLAIPGCAAILCMRYLPPTSMEGAGGGPPGFIARLTGEHPLLVGVFLFFALSEAIRYWRARRPGAVVEPRLGAGIKLSARNLVRLLVPVAAAALAALALRASVAETCRVVSASMLPTLDVGDRLLVDKLAYGVKLPLISHRFAPRLPHRGDVVVFRAGAHTGADGPGLLVKRVVGLPGDTVAYEGGRLILNRQPVGACDAGPFTNTVGGVTVRGRLSVEHLGSETYLAVLNVGERPFPAFTVPADQVFVVGDDRGMSSDSRVWNDRHGAGVPLADIEGRVTRIVTSARHEDGRLDLSRVMAPVGANLRQPGVDLELTAKRIGACLNAAATPAPARPR
jgi:signal peptidase I